MSYDPQNVFAKILRGELPCLKIHEDEHTLSFMDIMPQSDGHVLVIPKEPAETLLELSEQAAVACIRVVHRLAPVLKQAMDSDGVMIMQLNGAGAGQTVPHVHFHVIPRYSGRPMQLHAARPEAPDRLAAFAEKILAVLQAPPRR